MTLGVWHKLDRDYLGPMLSTYRYRIKRTSRNVSQPWSSSPTPKEACHV